MTQIVYFNGRRVAMDEGLEPIILFDRAKPGERVLVAVKLLETTNAKTFDGASAMVSYSGSRPDPTMLADQILAAYALVPMLGKDAESVKKAVEDAAAVDLKALEDGDSERFETSLRKAPQILAHQWEGHSPFRRANLGATICDLSTPHAPQM